MSTIADKNDKGPKPTEIQNEENQEKPTRKNPLQGPPAARQKDLNKDIEQPKTKDGSKQTKTTRKKSNGAPGGRRHQSNKKRKQGSYKKKGAPPTDLDILLESVDVENKSAMHHPGSEPDYLSGWNSKPRDRLVSVKLVTENESSRDALTNINGPSGFNILAGNTNYLNEGSSVASSNNKKQAGANRFNVQNGNFKHIKKISSGKRPLQIQQFRPKKRPSTANAGRRSNGKVFLPGQQEMGQLKGGYMIHSKNRKEGLSGAGGDSRGFKVLTGRVRGIPKQGIRPQSAYSKKVPGSFREPKFEHRNVESLQEDPELNLNGPQGELGGHYSLDNRPSSSGYHNRQRVLEEPDLANKHSTKTLGIVSNYGNKKSEFVMKPTKRRSLLVSREALEGRNGSNMRSSQQEFDQNRQKKVRPHSGIIRRSNVSLQKGQLIRTRVRPQSGHYIPGGATRAKPKNFGSGQNYHHNHNNSRDIYPIRQQRSYYDDSGGSENLPAPQNELDQDILLYRENIGGLSQEERIAMQRQKRIDQMNLIFNDKHNTDKIKQFLKNVRKMEESLVYAMSKKKRVRGSGRRAGGGEEHRLHRSDLEGSNNRYFSKGRLRSQNSWYERGSGGGGYLGRGEPDFEAFKRLKVSESRVKPKILNSYKEPKRMVLGPRQDEFEHPGPHGDPGIPLRSPGHVEYPATHEERLSAYRSSKGMSVRSSTSKRRLRRSQKSQKSHKHRKPRRGNFLGRGKRKTQTNKRFNFRSPEFTMSKMNQGYSKAIKQENQQKVLLSDITLRNPFIKNSTFEYERMLKSKKKVMWRERHENYIDVRLYRAFEDDDGVLDAEDVHGGYEDRMTG